MDLEIFMTIAVLGVFVALVALERVLPGYRYPDRPAWIVRGVAWFAAAFVVGSLVPLATDEFLARYTLLDLSGWGWWGIGPGVLTYQVLGYAWHRALHAAPILWRFHQTHHASERIDIWSALRMHPFDVAGWTVLVSTSSILLLGLSLEAALLNAFLANAVAWFGHTNLRTPRWLGYIIARPENHAAHHERGIHGRNYADLPLVDMLFGTFDNPRSAPAHVGFWEGASDRTLPLLLGQDVTCPSKPSNGGVSTVVVSR
jgi:sterol desaturase/sphingolipid hydroxylase (fatty acid hydroxylase superfamily)